MMWMWVVALGATLAGLLLAARAVLRADRALVRVRAGADGLDALPPATAALAAATRDTARARADLHDRIGPGPS